MMKKVLGFLLLTWWAWVWLAGMVVIEGALGTLAIVGAIIGLIAVVCIVAISMEKGWKMLTGQADTLKPAQESTNFAEEVLGEDRYGAKLCCGEVHGHALGCKGEWTDSNGQLWCWVDGDPVPF